MVLKGFKFGMLLQIAVGPICLFIFNEAIEKGLLNAFAGVIGVVIVDAIYIALSILGISALVEKKKKLLKYFGAIVLIVFGIKTIIDAINMASISIINVEETNYIRTCLTSLILTASNPLTIIFWSGVFSSKIVEEKFNRIDEMRFGIGAVIATLMFLSIISVIGQFTHTFLEVKYISILNILVGILLLYFGLRLALKKDKKS